MAGFEVDTVLQLYEEIEPMCVEYLAPHLTPSETHMQSGDILCIQKQINTIEEIDYLNKHKYHMNVAVHLKYLYNQVTVGFIPRGAQRSSKEVKIKLQLEMSYSDVTHALAKEIDSNPTHLHLLLPDSHGRHNHVLNPKLKPTLKDILMLSNKGNDDDTLYYHIHSTDVEDFHDYTFVEVKLCYPSLQSVSTKDLLLYKGACIGDMKKQLMEYTDHSPVDVYGVTDDQIYVGLEDTDIVKYLESTLELYAERAHDMDHMIDKHDQFITAHYYKNRLSKTHPIVFKFLVIKGELFVETKERLMSRIGLKSGLSSFLEYRIISPNQPLILDDDEYILSEYLFTPEDILSVTNVKPSSKSVKNKLYIKD